MSPTRASFAVVSQAPGNAPSEESAGEPEKDGDAAALLEYLAVDVGRRGAGVGRELFAAGARLPTSPMLVEVESVQAAPPGGEARRFTVAAG